MVNKKQAWDALDAELQLGIHQSGRKRSGLVQRQTEECRELLFCRMEKKRMTVARCRPEFLQNWNAIQVQMTSRMGRSGRVVRTVRASLDA